MAQWKVFVSEATGFRGDKGNPIVKLCICRYCGAADNDHDPHIPDEYKNRVSYESCSRCGFDLYAEEE
jgi:hypothetical protein